MDETGAPDAGLTDKQREFFAEREARRHNLAERLAEGIATDSPITLEIGSGHGHWLVAYAAAHPGEFCVGIDVLGGRIAKAEAKRAKRGLQNLWFVNTPLDDFVAALPSGVLFAKTFIIHPDPWPKQRHHKHRIIQPEFLAWLARMTVPGGSLFFRTDHSGYAAWSLRMFAESPDWTVLPGAPWPFEAMTVFQERTEGRHDIVATKRAVADSGPR